MNHLHSTLKSYAPSISRSGEAIQPKLSVKIPPQDLLETADSVQKNIGGVHGHSLIKLINVEIGKTAKASEVLDRLQENFRERNGMDFTLS